MERVGTLIKFLLSLCSIIFMLSISSPVLAQDQGEAEGVASTETTPEEKITILIERVQFVDDEGKELPAEEFLAEIKSAAGGEFDPVTISEDINQLRKKFPQFAEISLKMEPGEENTEEKSTLILIFEFQRKRLVRSIRVLIPSDVEDVENVRNRLRTATGQLLKGSKINKDIEMVQKEFIIAGYPKTEVKVEINPVKETESDVEVIFHVTPNSQKAMVTAVKFEGNKGVKTKKLKKQVKTQKKSFLKKKVFHLYDYEGDAQLLENFYNDEGYLDIVVESSYEIDDKGNTTVLFKIQEGKKYSIGNVTLVGNEKFKRKELFKKIKFKKGEAYNGKKIRRAMQSIREYYGERGYIRSEVQFDYDSETSDVQFKISEGKIYYIEDVVVEGNESMDVTTVLADVNFFPGEMVNTKKITQTLNKMKKTRFYDNVKIDYQVSSTKNRATVFIQVVEAREHYINFGVGTSGSGFNGSFGYSTPNLLSLGKGFSIQGGIEDEDWKLSLIFTDPHLFGSDYQLDVGIEYNDNEFDGFDQNKFGGQVMVKKMILENLKVGIGTRIDFVDINDVSQEILNEIPDAERSDRIVGLVGTFVYNEEERDEHGEAHKGYKIRMSLYPSYADEEAYIRAIVNAVGHVTLGENEQGSKHILTGRITLGYASSNTPFYEKLYAGGMRTIRGFRSRSITPDGSSVGGEALVSGGAYYSFPVYKETFKGVAFVEAASVGNGLDDLGSIRAVGGIGVKANLRKTFLRNSIEGGYVFPFLKEDGDKTKPFYFIFGDYDPAYDL